MKPNLLGTLAALVGITAAAEGLAEKCAAPHITSSGIQYRGIGTERPYFGHQYTTTTYTITVQKSNSPWSIVQELNAMGVRNDNYPHGESPVTIDEFLRQNPQVTNPKRLQPGQQLTYTTVVTVFPGLVDII